MIHAEVEVLGLSLFVEVEMEAAGGSVKVKNASPELAGVAGVPATSAPCCASYLLALTTDDEEDDTEEDSRGIKKLKKKLDAAIAKLNRTARKMEVAVLPHGMLHALILVLCCQAAGLSGILGFGFDFQLYGKRNFL